jgi:hypothetical protein
MVHTKRTEFCPSRTRIWQSLALVDIFLARDTSKSVGTKRFLVLSSAEAACGHESLAVAVPAETMVKPTMLTRMTNDSTAGNFIIVYLQYFPFLELDEEFKRIQIMKSYCEDPGLVIFDAGCLYLLEERTYFQVPAIHKKMRLQTGWICMSHKKPSPFPLLFIRY